jgi:triosephosphate isomerase
MAYEPVWAIGTGVPASGDQAQEAASFIRAQVREMHGEEVASSLLILYGGSVSSDNIAEFARQPDIDGALVGGASLRAESFLGIVQGAAVAKGIA